jgi:hypothetical protein
MVRIGSRGQVGFLFFRDGDLVHASTGRMTGELAVREMLGWQDGVFETWGGPWPEKETIHKPWQRVLLEAAQARDEESLPNVLSFPTREGAENRALERSAAEPPAIPSVIEAVTLTADGKLLHGEQSSELSAAAAYSVELADLIGEFMGLESFQSLEASFAAIHYLVGRTASGDIVAARAERADDLEAARKDLGL